MARSRSEVIEALSCRPRWTAEDAAAVLAAAASSGLSLSEFAGRHGLTLTRLERWHHRLGDAGVPVFHEVTAVPMARSGSGFELSLRNGRVVRLGPDFDADALVRLLAVIDEAPC